MKLPWLSSCRLDTFEGGRGRESRGYQVRNCCRRSSRQTATGHHLGRLKYRDIVKADSWAGIADFESCWSVGIVATGVSNLVLTKNEVAPQSGLRKRMVEGSMAEYESPLHE